VTSTQDLCDGVSIINDAVVRYENALRTGNPEKISKAWIKVREAMAYMCQMAAWKEDLTVEQMVIQGGSSLESLGAWWEKDLEGRNTFVS